MDRGGTAQIAYTDQPVGHGLGNRHAGENVGSIGRATGHFHHVQRQLQRETQVSQGHKAVAIERTEPGLQTGRKRGGQIRADQVEAAIVAQLDAGLLERVAIRAVVHQDKGLGGVARQDGKGALNAKACLQHIATDAGCRQVSGIGTHCRRVALSQHQPLMWRQRGVFLDHDGVQAGVA